MTSTASAPIRVLVWGENHHEKHHDIPRALYPDTMHGTIAAGLRRLLGDDAVVETATLDDPEHGLSEERLAQTDVLFWWGHLLHHEVDDVVIERVHRHVLGGLGFVALHSAHFSKVFVRLMGTTCALRWRQAQDRELVWTVSPTHPIAAGVPQPIVIPEQEMYGEFFDVPQPDELVFVSNFSGGEVFRSGMTFFRGHGRVFYFSPGDQDYPVYHQPEIQLVLANAARWARNDRPRGTARLAMHRTGEWDTPREWNGEEQS
ncbi:MULTISPECIES: ThuA domain-containing protein [Microbacterium]|uniref:ThuA domain-containing protein n=1 Tax=Microbacterium TaxID=33882 RepID=UPI000E767EEE|nr:MULTISPECIES: ThuA domain-containing protein [Microbacterium]RKE60300.1 trehalose utilization protein [Microbacterium sp. AG238]WJM14828.1 ThuA domain-containing protein [Microbacterium arborescens]